MRRIVTMIAAVFATAVLTVAFAPAAQASDQGCSNGTVCLWDQAYYQSHKMVLGAQWAQTSNWIPLYTIKNSVNERFTDRAVWTIFYRDGVLHRWDCLNPGDNRLGDGHYRANYVWIGWTGSRC